MSEAEALYRANGGKAIELTIAFDPRAPITPLQRKLLPPELATLAKHIDSSPASSEVERWHFRNMPEISSVYLSSGSTRMPSSASPGSYGVGRMSQADLDSIVRDKETLPAE